MNKHTCLPNNDKDLVLFYRLEERCTVSKHWKAFTNLQGWAGSRVFKCCGSISRRNISSAS